VIEIGVTVTDRLEVAVQRPIPVTVPVNGIEPLPNAGVMNGAQLEVCVVGGGIVIPGDDRANADAESVGPP